MKPLVIFLALIVSTGSGLAQKKMTIPRLTIAHILTDFAVTEFDNKIWEKASTVSIDRYWSGKAAPAGRHATARLVWSDTALYVRFEAIQDEPLVMSDPPNLATKTRGLWDRDVCEIFIAPETRNNYFELEIAPNGEWVDIALEITGGKRKSDFDYGSGMASAALIEDKKVVMAIKVEWKALGKTPKRGDIWFGNLFRCVGKDSGRGYLAWQPTETKKPNFHVPEKFGEFEFVK
jgi:hypothetical protein